MSPMHRGNLNDFISYLSQQRRNPMLDAIRPFLSRILAPIITAGLAFIAVKLGVTFGTDAAGHITEVAVVILVGIMQFVYGMLHRGIDKTVNPVDAASAPLATAGKIESEKGVP